MKQVKAWQISDGTFYADQEEAKEAQRLLDEKAMRGELLDLKVEYSNILCSTLSCFDAGEPPIRHTEKQVMMRVLIKFREDARAILDRYDSDLKKLESNHNDRRSI